MISNPQSRAFKRAVKDYTEAILEGMASYLWTYAVSNFSEADREAVRLRRLQNITRTTSSRMLDLLDMSEIRGNRHAVEAAEEAVWKNQNLLFRIPGLGFAQQSRSAPQATSIARRIPTIMTRIGFDPPFRAPHYTITAEQAVREVELCTGGVLYLDELEQFPLNTLRAIANRMKQGSQLAPIVVGAFDENVNVHSAPAPRAMELERHEKIFRLIPFPIQVTIEPIPLNDLRAIAPNQTSLEIRARIRRRAGDFMYVADQYPPGVMKAAKELAALYELDMFDLFDLAMHADGWLLDFAETGKQTSEDKRIIRDVKLARASEFGAALASMALRDHHSWFDKHARFELEIPKFTIKYSGNENEVTWEGSRS